ncbi:endonuclease/exonuclease/phosphatase family protein [Vibrio maerlii]|uniref:endonuclease/exonuclease/phosphatase family protein n=1 Tax=Vibrio maerlii TaxID=2231648 RepID=UPI000E3CBD39|nr:endonuclease/exonuclease/phosphatase family protein [Vibrio maerlii]
MSHRILHALTFGLGLLFFSFSTAADPTVVATWNIEWLASGSNHRIEEANRTDEDYQVLAKEFDKLNPDVLAFQEVNDVDALRRIVGNEYQIYLSDRSTSKYHHIQFKDLNQYTGFAIRNGIEYVQHADFRLLNDSQSKLRFASYMVIEANTSEPIHVVSVHLKAGCSGAFKSNRSCSILREQGSVLNDWIKQREAKRQQYIVLGDFNHNLSYPNDWFWNVMTKQTKADLATRNTDVKCKVRSNKNPNRTHQFRSLIDHIVIGGNIKAYSVAQQVFPVEHVLNYKLSDHCPVKAKVH